MTDKVDENAPGTGKHTPDWGRFGLSEDHLKDSEKSPHDSYQQHPGDNTQQNELFAQDLVSYT